MDGRSPTTRIRRDGRLHWRLCISCDRRARLYVTAWQVGLFERVLNGQRVHLARIFYDLVWVNASSRWTGPLINHLTPFLVNFYRGMGLLTREEEKRFSREREILTVESSEGTEDDNRRPSIPPQTTA